MPPTDCFEGADVSASIACLRERRHEFVGPALPSPVHHGTDPDLSALTPLPTDGAVPGLDLSPSTAAGEFIDSGGRVGVNQLQAVAMAKRKQRSAAGGGPVGGGGSIGAYAASTTTRSGRASGKETSHSHQPKRAAMQAGQGTAPCRMASSTARLQKGGVSSEADVGSGGNANRRTASTTGDGCGDAGDGPPRFDKLVAGGGLLAKPRLLSLAVYQSPGAASEDTEPATPESDGGLAKDSVESRDNSVSTSRGDASETAKDIDETIAKAKKTAAYIRLLLHAKHCQGGCCKEPGCDTTRQLVVHMRGCSMTGGVGCKRTCAQARKVLAHYAECSRRRALGSGSCLVCSLVARSATHGNSPSNRCNAASGLHGSRGFGKLPRTPLGCLGPPVASPAGGNAGCGQREIIARSAVEGVRSPVGISRLKQADFGQGPAFGGTCGSGAGAGGGLGGMSSGQKDGVFFRPRPRKARSDSWGGYDRRRLTRRTRFDSIPEGLAEEEEEDDLEKETNSEGGSEAKDEGGSRGSSETRSAISKAFISSHSL